MIKNPDCYDMLILLERMAMFYYCVDNMSTFIFRMAIQGSGIVD